MRQEIPQYVKYICIGARIRKVYKGLGQMQAGGTSTDWSEEPISLLYEYDSMIWINEAKPGDDT